MTDIVTRLRGYNPPDRTIDTQRQISVDIHEAADEIESSRELLRICRAERDELAAKHYEIERLRGFLAAERERIFVLADRNERLRLALREAMQQATEYDGLDVTTIGPQHWYSLAVEAMKGQP